MSRAEAYAVLVFSVCSIPQVVTTHTASSRHEAEAIKTLVQMKNPSPNVSSSTRNCVIVSLQANIQAKIDTASKQDNWLMRSFRHWLGAIFWATALMHLKGVWSLAFGLSIERPKSFTREALEKKVGAA